MVSSWPTTIFPFSLDAATANRAQLRESVLLPAAGDAGIAEPAIRALGDKVSEQFTKGRMVILTPYSVFRSRAPHGIALTGPGRS